jgi:hypothetical protein
MLHKWNVAHMMSPKWTIVIFETFSRFDQNILIDGNQNITIIHAIISHFLLILKVFVLIW